MPVSSHYEHEFANSSSKSGIRNGADKDENICQPELPKVAFIYIFIVPHSVPKRFELSYIVCVSFYFLKNEIIIIKDNREK